MAWMDDDLKKIWIKEIWLKHAQVECKKLGFQNSMFVFDALAPHFSDGVKISIIIYLSYTSWLYLEVLTHGYLSKETIQSFLEAYNNCRFKFPVAARRYMIDKVKEDLTIFLRVSRCSINVYGISSSDSLKGHSASFYQQSMEKALLKLEADIKQRRSVSYDCIRLNL